MADDPNRLTSRWSPEGQPPAVHNPWPNTIEMHREVDAATATQAAIREAERAVVESAKKLTRRMRLGGWHGDELESLGQKTRALEALERGT